MKKSIHFMIFFGHVRDAAASTECLTAAANTHRRCGCVHTSNREKTQDSYMGVGNPVTVNYLLGYTPRDNMAGKDISEMSFDEFFLGKKSDSRARAQPRREEAAVPPASEIDGSGFVRGRPKINVHGNHVSLFVPKYEGGRGAKYVVTILQGGKTYDLGRLKSSPLDSDVSSIPTEFDIMELGIDPLSSFILSIDGKSVYEGFEHTHLLFSAEGMPISRAEDTTIVMYRSFLHLWLQDAGVAASVDLGLLKIDTVEVARGGYVRVRDRPQQPSAKTDEKAKKDKPKAPKKGKPSASIGISAPEASAAVSIKGVLVPLYSSAPAISLEVSEVDADACVVKVEAPGRNDEVPQVSFGAKALEGAEGDVVVSVVYEGKALAKKRFFIIPGFSCDYSGKGDIPKEDILSFIIGGEEYHRDIYKDDLDGPYPFGEEEVQLSWNIPIVSFDAGSGMAPFREEEVQVDDLPDSVVVTVKGASKKAVFIGGAGKKVNLTPEWEDETIRIDTTPIRDAVFSSPNRQAELFITVNSCPVRRFLKVENNASMSASYSLGDISVSIRGQTQHLCRVFNIDKRVTVHDLQEGDSVIHVGPDAISAEIVEIRNGKEVSAETIDIRSIPFLSRDTMGDVWFYVSRDKRIPLPEGLLESSAKSASEVKKWYSQIVRMNPELKKVTPEMTVKAFAEFRASNRGSPARGPSFVHAR